MVKSQPDNHQHIQDLHTWAKRVRQMGSGDAGHEINRPFIPDPEIKAYFEDTRSIQKLLAALSLNEDHQVDPVTIRTKYAKVFLILLLTGKGHFIELFVRHDSLSDRKLPFRSQPDLFPPSTADADFFTSFYRQQWEFCAPLFEYGNDVQFDENEILPIISKEKLAGGGSAIAYKIKLHPAYNKLGCESPSREGSTNEDAHTFVLKTYNTPDAEQYYRNEVSGFLKLSRGRGPRPNIIGFHGSFVQNGTYNVLLEYADRGTLEQYFHSVQPPSSGRDTMKFWQGLFKISGALVAIHSVQPSDSAASSNSAIFQGYPSISTLPVVLAYISRWHQDVKPSNIFVKSKKGGSPYDCEFKLGDLGLSHFKKHVPSQGEVTDKDSYGTRAYGAPECYRADSDMEKILLLVKQDVDVWSLGCIYSEAAVWVVHAYCGLLEYRRRRGIETCRIPGFRDGDCFHDGWKVLGIVTKTHRTLADDIRPRDHVTGPTVEMVTKEMLIEPDSRPSAKFLRHRTKVILEDAETKLGGSASYAGNGSIPGTVAQSPPRTPPDPPPGHVPPRFSKSPHSQRVPYHIRPTSPASTSIDEDEFPHHESIDLLGKRVSRQGPYSDRPTRPRHTGLADRPSYVEYEDQDQFSESHLNRAFSEVVLSQNRSSGPSWPEASGTDRMRRRLQSNLCTGADTRNNPNIFAQDPPETCNVSQRSSFTAPPGVSRTSTTTLVQDPHNHLRGRRYPPHVTSAIRTPRAVSFDSPSVPSPKESQTRRRPPFLSVTVAQQWKSDKKEGKPVRLPGNNILADLNERDHVFLIDNSSSMLPHRRDVHDLFALLGYIVKKTDRDGIELCFTMSRDRRHRAKHTSQLLRILERVPYSGESNIRIQLGEILQAFPAKQTDQGKRWTITKSRSMQPVPPQTVYILTDGVWQPGCDITPMIKKLVEKLEKNEMEREQFGIQFIRFGNDPEGITRLNQLDSGLGLSMDVVDTEPSDGNVWKMLKGSVNYWFDDDDTAPTVTR